MPAHSPRHSRTGAFGSVESVAETLGDLVDLGARNLALWMGVGAPEPAAMESSIRLAADGVLPRLVERAGVSG